LTGANTLLIYLADLTHDYFKITQFTPTGIGFLAAYSKSKLEDTVDIRLFKSVNKLLDAVDREKPDLVGLSNYTWNLALSAFAGRYIKQQYPSLPIVMGGPNIRVEEQSVEAFLAENEFVDKYCMYGAEVSFYQIADYLISLPATQRSGKKLRAKVINGCYSISEGTFQGNSDYEAIQDLDEIPSPFLEGWMDPFLAEGCLPIVETNRGCPFSCTFCVWGISALNKLRKFSLERAKADLSYIAHSEYRAPVIVFGDANFGIIKRDVEIAEHIRGLYEETKSFSRVQLYWSKSYKPHMVDIGKALGHLTETYVAFQSLDPSVLENIKRRNINTDELLNLITLLKQYTDTAQTDILVGLPGETYKSHLSSLDQALAFGLNHIHGGEIRMLPGSEMDTPASRETFCLKTKYRFFEGGYGYYRNQLVYELEEGIRESNSMSEEEMIKLRGIRAFFYCSITLGEHLPLLPILNMKEIRFTKICEEMIRVGKDDPVFNESVGWLVEQSVSEWHDSPEHVKKFVSKKTNVDALLKDNIFVKLNPGFLARIYLDQEQYEAYYRVFSQVLKALLPTDNPKVLDELVEICKKRNFLVNSLRGNRSRTLSLTILPETYSALSESGFLPSSAGSDDPCTINLAIDDTIADFLIEFIESRPNLDFMELSQMILLQAGRFMMKPAKIV